jgi:hypothetical protein
MRCLPTGGEKEEPVLTSESVSLYLEQVDVVHLALKEEVVDGLQFRP